MRRERKAPVSDASALEHLENALQFLADARGRDRLRHGHRLVPARIAQGAAARRLLEAVARPVDGEGVLVEELANAPGERDLMGRVVAPVAAAVPGVWVLE